MNKYQKTKTYVKCADSHPVLKFKSGAEIWGGAIGWPIVKDANTYIGLDPSMPITTKA